MAENQEKDEKKPKATLIKHRKGESAASRSSSEEGQKRKTKIVVKRKSKAQQAGGDQGAGRRVQSGQAASESSKEAQKDESVSEAQETSSAAEVQFDQSSDAEQTATESKSASESSAEASQGEAAAGTGETPVSGGESPAEGSGTASAAATDEAAATGEAAASKGEGAAPAKDEPGEAETQSGKGTAGGETPSPAESSGQGETRTKRTFRRQPARPSPAPYRRTGSTGKHVSTSELEARAERAESRPAPGPGRSSGGGERRGGGPQGGGGGPRSFPPRGGGAPPPPGPGQQKGNQRKFFKSKKKDQGRGRDKREKAPEKEIHYKQKRNQNRTNPVPKQIEIMENVSIADLAKKMNLKASDIIGTLMKMGMMVTINQQIDAETAEIVAAEYGSSTKVVSLYDETVIETAPDDETDMHARPPIVTVMGHVDHGKTKLLDAIRSKNVVAGEFGGITQHIGAYQVETSHGKVTFLDTPGHEAFTLMRARGANITDVVILVVAADDGVMPQTREAVDHAKEAGVPIIVAINKIDKPDAKPDRVKQQLSDLDLMPEAWGGSTLFCEVSALKNEGVKELLETVALQAEVLELQANHNCRAEGKIIETRIDAGRGTVSSVLIERGTLKVGDAFVAGVYPGRVRAMFNDRGERVEEATPSMPVEILGLTGIPEAGDPFQVTESDKQARQIGDKRQELRKLEDARNVRKITLDNLYDTIQEGEIQDLKVVIKGDVHGSVEAVKNALEGLSTDEIRLSAIRAAAGAINENDVMLASASNAIIVGFHVRPTPRAAELAEREKVEIRKYGIIYDAVDDIRTAMEGMLAPELREETVGTVEVREVFKVPKIGAVAGCYVKSGTVKRNARVHVIREGVEVHTGKIDSLKRFKDDARQVEAGYECGIGLERFDDIKVGDEFEVFEVREIAKKLGESRAEKAKGSSDANESKGS